jgi:hypothetical protein
MANSPTLESLPTSLPSGGPNTHILIAGGILVADGIVKAFRDNKPKTTPIVGGIIFVGALGILDLFGGNAAKLASAIAMLAVVYVIVQDFPWSYALGAVKIINLGATAQEKASTPPATGSIPPIFYNPGPGGIPPTFKQ